MRHLLEKSINLTKEKLALFDNDYHDFKEFLFVDLEVGYSVLSRYFNKKPSEKTTEQEFQAALLLWKSLNSSICAYQSLRLGFYDEPLTVCRTIIEHISVAYAIHQSQAVYQKFVSGKYDSPRAIKESKKFVPLIGNIYGLLSKEFSHTYVDRALPASLTDKTTGRIQAVIGGLYNNQEKLSKKAFDTSFLIVILITSITAILTEFLFFRFVDSPKFCSEVGENQIKVSYPKYVMENFNRLLESI